MMLLSQGSAGSALRQIYIAGGNLQADESGVGGISGSIPVNTGTNVMYSLIESQSIRLEYGLAAKSKVKSEFLQETQIGKVINLLITGVKK
jgi:hypothetical protein